MRPVSAEGDEDELSLGEQQLPPVESIELEDLERLYETTVMNVPDTRYLLGVHAQMQAVMEDAADRAAGALRVHDMSVETPAVRYNPSMAGAEYDDGVLAVGRPGSCDRPYYLVTEFSHELLHHYLREEELVDEYTAREEALAQVWLLHQDDVIGYETADRLTRTGDDLHEDEAERRLDDARTVYNEYDGEFTSLPDGFGDDLHWYATRFLDLYREVDGDRTEKMQAVLDVGMNALTAD